MASTLDAGGQLTPGGTLTSTLTFCELQLQTTGLYVIYDGVATGVPGLTGFTRTTSAKLTAQALTVYGTGVAGGSLSIPSDGSVFPFNANTLEVQDNGEVYVYDAVGDYVTIYPLNLSPEVLVSTEALATLDQAVKDVETQVRLLKRSARPVSVELLEQLDGRKAPKESGFPHALNPNAEGATG